MALWCIHNKFNSVQLLSHVQLFATLWTAAHQASLSITNSRSLLKPMSIESVMPSNHLILCCLLLLLPLIFPSIRVFSNELVPHIRWPKYWSFSFSISPSNEYSGLISFRMDWFDLFTQYAKQVIKQHVQNDDNLKKCNKHKQKNSRRLHSNISQELLLGVGYRWFLSLLVWFSYFLHWTCVVFILLLFDFFLFWPCCVACGILGPLTPREIKPLPLQWKCRILEQVFLK